MCSWAGLKEVKIVYFVFIIGVDANATVFALGTRGHGLLCRTQRRTWAGGNHARATQDDGCFRA